MAVTVVGTAIANLGINTREWITGLNAAQKKFVSFGAAMQVTGFRLGVVLAAAFGAPALAVTKFGASFEKAFAGIRKTVDQTANYSFKMLESHLRSIAKESTFTFEQLSDLARIGGQLGVGIADLGKFTEAIGKLSIAAADMPAEEAAVGLARLINITQSSMKDVDIYASVLAKLGDSFATTEARILNFSERIAGLAQVTDMSANDALALGAAFTAVVPGVELVATQLSKGMATFAKAVAQGGDKLKFLDQMVQHTGYSFSTLFKVDAAKAISEFLAGLGKLSQSDAFAALDQLGLKNQRAAQAFLAAAGSADQFTRALEESRQEASIARTEFGKLETTFTEQMRPIASQWAKLKNNIKDAMYEIFLAWRSTIEDIIQLGNSLVPVLYKVAEVFAVLPDSIKLSAVAAIGLLGAFAAITQIGGMMISVFVPLKNILTGLIGLFVAHNTAVTATVGGYTMATTKAGTAARAMTALGGSAKLAAIGIWGLVAATVAYAAVDLKKSLTGIIPKFAILTGGVIEGTLSWDQYTEKLRELILLLPFGLKHFVHLFDVINAGIKWVTGWGDAFEEAGRKFKSMVHDAKVDDVVAEYERFTKVTQGMTAEQLQATRRLHQQLFKGTAHAWEESADMVMRHELDKQKALETTTEEIEKQKRALEGLQGVADKILSAYVGDPFSIESRAKAWKDAIKDVAKDANLGSIFLFAPTKTPELGPAPGGGFEDFVGPEIPQSLRNSREEFERMVAEAQDADAALDRLANAFRVMGFTAQDGIMRIIGAFTAMNSAIKGIGTLFTQNEGKTVLGELFGDVKGMFKGGLKGIFAGIGSALSIAGPFVQLGVAFFGAIKSIFTSKPRWQVIAEDSAEIFGKAFSEELSKEIAKSEKVFKDFGMALAANIGNIIEEVGVSAENFQQVWGHLFLLFDKTKKGVIDFATANEQATKSFGPMIEHLRTLGSEGSLMIGEVVKRMRELGLATEEVNAHMKEQGQVLMDSLAPALQFIAGLEDMTAEEAQAFSGVVAAAWAGAVAATGSFIGAVAALGDEFGNALQKIMEALGPDGANIVGPIASIYNIIKNNQEAFNAIQGIVAGLDAMAQMGILTQESLAAMGEAVRATFERILAKTSDMNAALQASWPELVKLYDWYKQLGMDVPPWLEKLIAKGQEMGLSMEVPLSTQEALNRIVEILEAIARALGHVEQSAKAAGSAIGDIPTPPGPSGGGGGVPHMQHGGYVAAAPPHGSLAILGEREGEFVIPESDMADMMGGGGGINIGDVNFHVQGRVDPDDARKFANSFIKIVRDNIGNARSEMLREINKG